MPLLFIALILLVSTPLAAAERTVNYTNALTQFQAIVADELKRSIIPGVSVAWIDDQRTVFAGGFGFADKQRKMMAGPDTIYRAGSISKLFTAIAAMQLAEQGKLDLDAPINKHLADFRIIVPFDNARPITLRQLMCHRSGIIRESPVGGYFDDAQAGVEKTIASITDCVLVYPPDTKTQYSNVGPTIVGLAVQRAAGISFEQYQGDKLLKPMGMGNSAWLFRELPAGKAATGYMRIADGKNGFFEIPAPQFDLGTIPAGNLYTSAADLAHFASMLLAEGESNGTRLLKPDSLQQMFTPQLTKDTKGFGLGFSINEFRGHKTVQHMGAVYGFTSFLIVLPKEKIAAVVLANEDIAVGPVVRLIHAALSLMLEAKLGEKPPLPTPAIEVAAADLAALTGHYESQSYWAELSIKDGALLANISGQPMTLTPRQPLKFEASGRYVHESPFDFEKDAAGFTALGQKFTRIDPTAAPPSPTQWDRLLGSYGPSFIPLIISIRHGHLYAMTENMFDYRLHPVNQNVFRLPPGLYNDEHIVFNLSEGGSCESLILANMRLRIKSNP